jgi:hypothetical protein
VKAFYDELLAKGKTKMQALIAVMRKLLHAIPDRRLGIRSRG